MAILPELALNLNNFQQQKILSINDSVAQILINLFLMRPGNLPSLPHIGINLPDYLYRTAGEINVDELKNTIATQCNELLNGVVTGEIDVIFLPDYKGQPMLIVAVEILNTVTVNIGFTKSAATNELNYLYQFENQLSDINNQLGGVL
jgi:hypothetical protein